jgi:hypothetical protein
MQNQADFKLVFVIVVEELDHDPRLVKFTDLNHAKVSSSKILLCKYRWAAEFSSACKGFSHQMKGHSA